MSDMLWCAVQFSAALHLQAYHGAIDPRSAFAWESAMYWQEEAADLADNLRACHMDDKAREMETLSRAYVKLAHDLEEHGAGREP